MNMVSVILNRDSGTLRTTDMDAFERRLLKTLDDAGVSVASLHRGDRPLDETLMSVADDDSDCVLVVGGDGSVSAAASVAWRHNKILAVLPGGTMNLYARTLGMPVDLDDSLKALATAIADARIRKVDIATANGAPFVHQFTVGLHANAVRLRKLSNYSTRLGKLFATARAFASVTLARTSFAVTLRGESLGEEFGRLSAVSVSNNLFGGGHVPFADRPDDGVLGVYRSSPVNALAAMRLIVDSMRGEFASNADVRTDTCKQITLEFPGRGRRDNALLDGELIPLAASVEIVQHAAALRVVRPYTASDG